MKDKTTALNASLYIRISDTDKELIEGLTKKQAKEFRNFMRTQASLYLQGLRPTS